MVTPKILLTVAGAGVPLGLIVGIAGLALRGKWKWIAAVGAGIFFISLAIVLWCPICITCGGAGANGMKWEGTCCSRSWASTKKVPWWVLVTEPWLWQ